MVYICYLGKLHDVLLREQIKFQGNIYSISLTGGENKKKKEKSKREERKRAEEKPEGGGVEEAEGLSRWGRVPRAPVLIGLGTDM